MKVRGFHISVTTGLEDAGDPSVLGGLSLDHDLRLVKAALLYADDVTLYSPAASLALSVAHVKHLRVLEQIEVLEYLIPYIVTDLSDRAGLYEALRLYKIAKRERHPGVEASRYMQLLDGALNWDGIVATAEQQARESKVTEITRAIGSKRLHVHDFLRKNSLSKAEAAARLISHAAPDANSAERSQWGDDFIDEYTSVLTTSVSGGMTYPLFDAQSGNLLSLGISEGKFVVSDSGLVRGRHSALAADLLDRLPLFEQASVSEILDIRKELAKPLIRFRRAITSFSATVKAAPWDEDFVTEADVIFHRDVDPVVQEIEELVQNNRYLMQLIRKIGLPVGALTAVMSRIADLPEIIAQATNNPASAHILSSGALGAGLTTAGATALKAAWDTYDKGQEIRQQELFFYYRAKKKLS